MKGSKKWSCGETDEAKALEGLLDRAATRLGGKQRARVESWNMDKKFRWTGAKTE